MPQPLLAAPRRAAVAIVLLACAGAALAAPGPGEPPVVERQYQLRFLSNGDGIALATSLCPEGGVCQVGTAAMTGALFVHADVATQERIARALREADKPPADQAFQLTLLQADRTGSGGPGRLPPAASKALADLADFLPYSRYQLLDSAFVRTTRDARVVVQGMEGHSYEVHLRFRGDARTPGSELLVEQFLLRLIPADVLGYLMGSAELAAGAAGPGSALVARPGAPGAAAPPAGAASGAEPGHPVASPPTPTPGPGPSPLPTLAENLLDTSFSIRRGETVVVGTSKLDGGDRALVVLLTALP